MPERSKLAASEKRGGFAAIWVNFRLILFFFRKMDYNRVSSEKGESRLTIFVEVNHINVDCNLLLINTF